MYRQADGRGANGWYESTRLAQSDIHNYEIFAMCSFSSVYPPLICILGYIRITTLHISQQLKDLLTSLGRHWRSNIRSHFCQVVLPETQICASSPCKPQNPPYSRLEVWWVLPNGIISQFTFFDTSGWSQVLRTWDVTNKQTNKTFPRKYYPQFRKGRPVSEKDPNVGCRGNSIDHLVLVPLWPQTEKIEL